MDETELANLDKIPATVENDDVDYVDDVDDVEDTVKEGGTYMKGGGDEDGGEWYNRDKSEETGFLRLFGKKDDKKESRCKHIHPHRIHIAGPTTTNIFCR